MHSFRLYLINAIHILTFPYRFVNIYFCVFSDLFQSCRFFIDKSFKAQKPPDAKRFAENRIAPPPRPRRQPQRVSAEPRARQCFRAAPHGEQAGRLEESLAARRQTALQTLCNRFSPRPRRAFAFRPASDQPPVLPTRRRLRMARQTAHAENRNRNNRTPITFDGKRKRPCLYSLRHILTQNAVINMADQQQKNTIVIPYRILYFLIGQDTEKATEVPNHPQKVIAQRKRCACVCKGTAAARRKKNRRREQADISLSPKRRADNNNSLRRLV